MNNDLISRSALLDSFRKRCREDCEYCPFAIYNPEKPEIVCGLIRKAPAVDAEPVRHGRWEVNMVTEYKSYPAYTYKSGYKCSLCGRRERTNKEPYCHCGAKMDLEEIR